MSSLIKLCNFVIKPTLLAIPWCSSSSLIIAFNISGFNDNSGNDIVLSTANRNQAIVENELGTRFTSLDKNNASLPKIQYRYDLSGSKASSSLQVGGSQAGVGGINWIDISINIPDVADNSLNWIPSNANPDTDPNSWTSTLTSSTYPLSHKELLDSFLSKTPLFVLALKPSTVHINQTEYHSWDRNCNSSKHKNG